MDIISRRALLRGALAAVGAAALPLPLPAASRVPVAAYAVETTRLTYVVWSGTMTFGSVWDAADPTHRIHVQEPAE